MLVEFEASWMKLIKSSKVWGSEISLTFAISSVSENRVMDMNLLFGKYAEETDN